MQHEEIEEIVEEIIGRISTKLEDFRGNKIGERYERFVITSDIILHIDMLEHFFLDERYQNIGIGLYEGHREITYKRLVSYSVNDIRDCMINVLVANVNLFEDDFEGAI